SSKPNRQGSPSRKIYRERMLPQSTDASALGLHSCRALSSESVHRQYTLKAGNVKTTKSVTHVPGRKCYPCIGTHTSSPASDATPLGLNNNRRLQPRVVAARQPWALGRSPVGANLISSRQM